MHETRHNVGKTFGVPNDHHRSERSTTQSSAPIGLSRIDLWSLVPLASVTPACRIAPDFPRDRLDRRVLPRILTLVLDHQPDRPVDFRRKPRRSGRGLQSSED